MPTYDYVCEACGHKFEAFHSMTAKPLRDCPKCKKAKVKRMIGGGSGIIFKGSGFYQTDYKSKGKSSSKESKPSTDKPCGGGSCAPKD